jgi:hypothetical protein
MTLDDVVNRPEDAPDSIETQDYSPYELIPVGYYLSNAREIQPKKGKDSGKLYYEVRFTSGLEDPSSGVSYGKGRWPERMFLFPNLRTREGKPGQTSDVADYLRSCGIDPKGLASVVDGLKQSLDVPVMVFVSWTNETERLPDGSWTKEVCRGKDFNMGTVAEPNYQTIIEKEGVSYRARHKAVGFRKVS